jgi:hypothetical protein
MICPVYTDIRQILFDEVNIINPNFVNQQIDEQFLSLFQNGDLCSKTAKATSEILKRRRHFIEINYVP